MIKILVALFSLVAVSFASASRLENSSLEVGADLDRITELQKKTKSVLASGELTVEELQQTLKIKQEEVKAKFMALKEIFIKTTASLDDTIEIVVNGGGGSADPSGQIDLSSALTAEEKKKGPNGDVCPSFCAACAEETSGQCKSVVTQKCSPWSEELAHGSSKKYSCPTGHAPCWAVRIHPGNFEEHTSDKEFSKLVIGGENLHKCMTIYLVGEDHDCKDIAMDQKDSAKIGMTGHPSEPDVNTDRSEATFKVKFSKVGKYKVCVSTFYFEEKVEEGVSPITMMTVAEVGPIVIHGSPLGHETPGEDEKPAKGKKGKKGKKNGSAKSVSFWVVIAVTIFTAFI
eukprot:Platyproteum_vivax@DN2081_c0_g1_i1.p1